MNKNAVEQRMNKLESLVVNLELLVDNTIREEVLYLQNEDRVETNNKIFDQAHDIFDDIKISIEALAYDLGLEKKYAYVEDSNETN